MNSIGETLRRERERRNLDLEQIARETKISARMLEAIEGERFDRLPGGVFAKSFVRQYARLLGLDDAELVSELDRVLAPPPDAPQQPERPKPVIPEIRLPQLEAWQSVGDGRFRTKSSLPALALVVVVMLLCSLVYAWWQRARRPAPQVASAPAAQLPPLPMPVPPVPSPALPPEPATPQPGDTSAPASGGAPTASPAAGAGPSSAPAAPQSTPVNAPPVAAVAAKSNPDAAVRLQITAEESVWVLVRTDGKYLFSGTLAPNQVRTVEAGETVLLRLGNAGGVSVTLNGKPVGPLGPKGQIRTVQFTSGGFQIVPPPPKPSAAASPDEAR